MTRIEPRHTRSLAAALTLLTALTGCATPRGGVSVLPPPPPPRESGESPAPPRSARPPERPPSIQKGEASWYGAAHHGHVTASGEPYDMYRFTAAHPSLPLGAHVLVTNLKNGRSVEVRVNDRGPTVAGRIIDLSYAAARALGAVGDGVIPVSLRVLSIPQ
jgi:rare lipoprotein A